MDDRSKSNVLFESTMYQYDGIGVKTGNGKIIRSDLLRKTEVTFLRLGTERCLSQTESDRMGGSDLSFRGPHSSCRLEDHT